jgi:hypothetical protein
LPSRVSISSPHTNSLAILVRSSIDNYGADSVIVLDGLGKGLEDQGANALASSEARLGSVIKGESLTMLIEDATWC